MMHLLCLECLCQFVDGLVSLVDGEGELAGGITLAVELLHKAAHFASRSLPAHDAVALHPLERALDV